MFIFAKILLFGRFLTAHTAQGVDIREGVGLDHLIERDGRVGAAKLSDGSEIEIDFAQPTFSAA